ncbi:NADH dehydrogenase [ubiquinone] 1 beta subcomplex subunit 3 isoform X2 [Tachysurus fulvidraco]|uniref:NADH dehydrogenase [ubiquinone] 1 beta subcomplex subunit 3 isoform X2 n=1 Tax=Tachysurus fulvidraco TaxID=1234273 RepID=UPI000F4F7717|nr:NADH dehydrogenase [ubiquinone] 1 beta subcomplex subunit 3 isoform X2 [Tachysurus fulvidraco]
MGVMVMCPHMFDHIVYKYVQIVNCDGWGSWPQQAVHARLQDVEMARYSSGVHTRAARTQRTEGPVGKERSVEVQLRPTGQLP